MITALAGWVVFGESLPGLWWVGAGGCVVGCVVIGRREEGGDGGGERGVELGVGRGSEDGGGRVGGNEGGRGGRGEGREGTELI